MGNRGRDQGGYNQRPDRQQDKAYGGNQQRDGGGRPRDEQRESRPPRINKMDSGEVSAHGINI